MSPSDPSMTNASFRIKNNISVSSYISGNISQFELSLSYINNVIGYIRWIFSAGGGNTTTFTNISFLNLASDPSCFNH